MRFWRSSHDGNGLNSAGLFLFSTKATPKIIGIIHSANLLQTGSSGLHNLQGDQFTVAMAPQNAVVRRDQ